MLISIDNIIDYVRASQNTSTLHKNILHNTNTFDNICHVSRVSPYLQYIF